MHKLSVLVLIFAIVAAKDLEFGAQMEQLESSKFGRTLLQTIYMQLQTEDPVANLIEMMQGLQAQLEAEQERDDERNERTQFNCDADLEQLEQVIATASQHSLNLKSILDGLNPQKSQAVSALNRKNSEIVELNEELELQTEKRSEEKARYEDTLDELEQTLYGLNQVRSYFNQYLDELSKNRRTFDKPEPQEESEFLQHPIKKYVVSDDSDSDEEGFQPTVSGFAQITASINKVKHQIKQEGYKALIQVLTDISSEIHARIDEASEAELLTRKIIAIIKQIEQFIQDDRLKQDQSESARQALFDELAATYTQQIVQTQADKTGFEGLIESLSNQIQGASNDKFETDLRVTQKTSELDDREVECNEAHQDYEVEKEKRIQQKAALAQALDLISSKLGQLKKELLEKGGY